MARKIEIQIVGDADSFHKALGRATSASGKLGSAMGGALKVGAVAGAAALAGVGFAAARGISDLMESQRVTAQTGAVLKSTGRAAGVTEKQVGNLANRISAYSGIDDEAVQAGENMLLTFTNIRNEAGKGNDIFNQSTKVLADLSTAMGTDMKSSAIQLGKALNDPVKGITSLTRVGVTFTEGQKKQIAALTKAGDKAGAQKVILKELNKEFGGSAKAAGDTLPGQLHKLSNAFDNAASAIVGRLLPPVTRFIQWATPLIVSGMAAVDRMFRRLSPTIDRVAGAVSRAATGAWPLIVRAMRGAWRFIQAYVIPIVVQLAGIIRDSMAAIGRVVQQHGTQIARIMHRVGTFIQDVGKVAMPILRYALVKVLPVAIGIAIDFIDKLTGFIGKVSDKLRSWADRARSVAARVKGYLSGIADKFQPITDAVRWLLDHLNIHFNITATGTGASLLGRLGSGALSGITGGLSDFARASGGPVLAGHSYVVGEKGPEILNMASGGGGHVTSNRDSRAIAGSSDVHVTVLLDGAPIAARVRAEQDRTASRIRGRRGWSA